MISRILFPRSDCCERTPPAPPRDLIEPNWTGMRLFLELDGPLTIGCSRSTGELALFASEARFRVSGDDAQCCVTFSPVAARALIEQIRRIDTAQELAKNTDRSSPICALLQR
jgi:hypothetical protein